MQQGRAPELRDGFPRHLWPSQALEAGKAAGRCPRPFPDALSLRLPERTFHHHEVRFTHAPAPSGEGLPDGMVATRQARRRASWRSREPRSGTTHRLGGGGRQVWLLRGGVSCWVFLMVRVRPVPSLTPAPRLVAQTVARTENISSPRAPLRLTLLPLTPDGDTLGIIEGSAFVLSPLEFERTLDRTASPADAFSPGTEAPCPSF